MKHPAKVFLGAVIVLVNTFVACTGSMSAEVLCVGTDGHVAIEHALARQSCSCGLTAEREAGGAAGVLSSRSCVDIPIGSEAKIRSVRSTPNLKPPFNETQTAGVSTTLFDLASLPRTAETPNLDSPPSGALGSIRTIVLLV